MSNSEVIVFSWPLQLLLRYQGTIGKVLAADHQFTLIVAVSPLLAQFRHYSEEKIPNALNVYNQQSISRNSSWTS